MTLPVNVAGGGVKGQKAAAVTLGTLGAAFYWVNEESRGVLKSNRMLTRDARVVEEKESGSSQST
jgi:small subunit ribosomal protein S9